MATNTRVNLARLGYVIYEHPDIEKFRRFAESFGLTEVDTVDGDIFYRGYGKDQILYIARHAPEGSGKRFLGAGFCAQSQQDFERACQLEGATELDASKRPGGGKLVSIKDPNGYEMQVYWGQKERVTPSDGISNCIGGHPVNGAINKQRKGEFTRMEKGPAQIHKLGHFGYHTDNYEKTCEWYRTNFNFKPMDTLWAPGNENFDVAAFHCLDLGKEYVDHHCLLVVRGETPGTSVHHSSFEVEDLDTQFMGHQWLQAQGYDLVWGIGRHVHGSQVFDYWYDSSHFIVEHYADGDIVNEDTKTTRAEAGNMAVWGPPVPAVWGGKKSALRKFLPLEAKIEG